MTREEFKDRFSKKEYLGDGLYVEFDGYHFILSAERENGWNWVGLEPHVFDALIRHRKLVYSEAEKIESENEKIPSI